MGLGNTYCTLYVHCTNLDKGSSVQRIYLEKQSKPCKELSILFITLYSTLKQQFDNYSRILSKNYEIVEKFISQHINENAFFIHNLCCSLDTRETAIADQERHSLENWPNTVACLYSMRVVVHTVS
jgi:hypothetical protein